MSLRTTDEQAALWRTSSRAIVGLITRKELRAVKIAGRWLIDPADADAYQAARMNITAPRPTARRPRPRVRRAS